MNSCIDRLLSINDPCGSESCTGIYNITDVIGFTWGKAAGIAEGNFKEYTGYQIAQKVRRLSAKTAMSDVMAQMYVRGWATGLTAGEHSSGEFKTNKMDGTTAKRGIQITAKSKCGFSGLKLKSISVKGCGDVSTILYIEADGVVSELPITIEAYKVHTIVNLCDANGVNIFSTTNGKITIWIEDVNFKPIEVKPNCSVCTGSPTTCADSKGWTNNGTAVLENSKQGFGISAVVACECDYDKILCALPNDEFKAQIIRYQASIQFARLALETERFNYFTIYGREELQQYIAIAQNGYTKRINEYVDSLRNWFTKNTYCGCIECFSSTTKSLI